MPQAPLPPASRYTSARRLRMVHLALPLDLDAEIMAAHARYAEAVPLGRRGLDWGGFLLALLRTGLAVSASAEALAASKQRLVLTPDEVREVARHG